MTRKHIHAALAVMALSFATLATESAYADNPHADKAADKPQKAADKAEKAADKAEKAAEKAEKAADKTADKAADKAGEKGEKAKMGGGEGREARRHAEHAAQKEKLAATLKGPMDEALKQELRRHAERLARLDRIKSVAQEAKDNDAVERATKLVTKENDRHDKWMGKHANGATTTPAAATTGGVK